MIWGILHVWSTNSARRVTRWNKMHSPNKRGFIACFRYILIKHAENIEYLLNNSTIATKILIKEQPLSLKSLSLSPRVMWCDESLVCVCVCVFEMYDAKNLICFVVFFLDKHVNIFMRVQSSWQHKHVGFIALILIPNQ